MVPRVGAVGAASTTTLTFWVAMMASLWLVYRRCGAAPGLAVLRVVPVSVAAFAAARLWEVPGLWVVPQLLVLGIAVGLSLFATRLVTSDDVAFVRSLFARTPSAPTSWALRQDWARSPR
jgi:hypothetical protein